MYTFVCLVCGCGALSLFCRKQQRLAPFATRTLRTTGSRPRTKSKSVSLRDLRSICPKEF